jgi:multiple sugar transport system ATP-binding protein
VRLQQIGTPKDIYERPANIFVARFIGSRPMNLFRGGRDGPAFRAEAGGVLLPLPEPVQNQVADGQPLLMAPVRKTSRWRARGGGEQRRHAQLDRASRLGPKTLVGFVWEATGRRYGQDTTDWFARVPGYRTHEPGDPVAVRFDRRRLVFFSLQTGLSLESDARSVC